MKNRFILLGICFCFFSCSEFFAKDQVIDIEKDIVVAKKKKKKVKRPRSGIIEHKSFASEFNEKEFSEERKKACEALVKKGEKFLKKHNEIQAFRSFTYDPDFVQGELYLFVYNVKGVCLAHGEQSYLIWQNLYDYKDTFGNYVVRSIIEEGQKGDGWVTYEWKRATKISYVREVKKNGKAYIIGCGFYPHSKKDTVVNLVDGAANLFNDLVQEGKDPSEVFGVLTYALGRWVIGDLYLFALDFDGNLMAQGDMPGLIGQNVLEYKDSTGKFLNKEIIKKLKSASEGIWVDYTSKRAPKRTYARKVQDKKEKNYFIAAGYYPTADRGAAVDLVRKGYRYMKMHGIFQAINQFSSRSISDFRFGDLFLFMYDLNGKLVAHGTNPDIIGKDHFDLTDDDGKYYVQEMIDKAQSGGGWMDYRKSRSSRFVYVELIEIGKQKFVIGCGINPISKPETMQLLVKGGVSLLRDSKREEAFDEFVRRSGDFTRGDLGLFAFDFNKICYAYEDNYDYIWRDFSKIKDPDGKKFINDVIKTAKDGAATIIYTMGGRKKMGYVDRVDKDGISYVVGSSFYL